MELLVIFVIIFIIYGAGWIWQTVNDLLRDLTRNFGPSAAEWCVESVDNFDYLFAELTVSNTRQLSLAEQVLVFFSIA